MFYRIAFIAMVCSLTAIAVRGQTIALVDENDSLIIRQKLKSVVISSDFSRADEETILRYSENIDDVVDAQNGLSLCKRGNYAAEVVHRGMSSERMTTSINGMKIFGACTDKMDPVTSYVSNNNLESMTMESGYKSNAFGPNTGGHFDMQTKEAILNDSKKIRGNASLGANGASQGGQASFNTNYSEKNWGLRLNAMAAKHKNYKAGGGEEILFSQYEKTNFGASFKSKLSSSNFLLIDYIHDDARNVGYPALPMDVSRATADIYSLTFRHFLKGPMNGKINAKVYGNNIRHVMDDSQRDVVMRMDMPGLSDTYGGYVQLETRLLVRHDMEIVLDGYQNRSYAEMTMYPENEEEMFMLTWPDVYRTILGSYIRDRVTLNNGDHVLASFRFDIGQSEVRDEFGKKQLSVFDYDLNAPVKHKAIGYSLGYEMQFNENTKSTLELTYSERLPTVTEQFAYYIFNSQDAYDYIGSPYLKNEEAVKAELLFDQTWDNFTWNASLFSYYMPNYILGIVDSNLSAMTIGAEGVKRFENLEYATMSGVEAGLSWHPISWLSIATQITFNYGEDNERRPLPLMSPFRNTSSISLHSNRQRFDVNVVSASEQNRYSELAGENRTPAYAIVNLSYARHFDIDPCTLSLSMGVDNLFDEYYYDHIDWVDIPRIGRNFFVKFRLQF